MSLQIECGSICYVTYFFRFCDAAISSPLLCKCLHSEHHEKCLVFTCIAKNFLIWDQLLFCRHSCTMTCFVSKNATLHGLSVGTKKPHTLIKDNKRTNPLLRNLSEQKLCMELHKSTMVQNAFFYMNANLQLGVPPLSEPRISPECRQEFECENSLILCSAG